MKRVGVYYSVGPHFTTALKAARTLGDTVVAIVPPHVNVDESPIDQTIMTEKGHYTPRDVAANRHLINQLRAENFDAFVVLFDSPQLRILASLVNAPESWYCAPHGHLTKINGTPLGVALTEIARRARGWTLYARIWLHVHLRKIADRP